MTTQTPPPDTQPSATSKPADAQAAVNTANTSPIESPKPSLYSEKIAQYRYKEAGSLEKTGGKRAPSPPPAGAKQPGHSRPLPGIEPALSADPELDYDVIDEGALKGGNKPKPQPIGPKLSDWKPALPERTYDSFGNIKPKPTAHSGQSDSSNISHKHSRNRNDVTSRDLSKHSRHSTNVNDNWAKLLRDVSKQNNPNGPTLNLVSSHLRRKWFKLIRDTPKHKHKHWLLLKLRVVPPSQPRPMIACCIVIRDFGTSFPLVDMSKREQAQGRRRQRKVVENEK